ncbi:MAG: hypothetical protein ACLRR6_11125 [Oscillospiraceae bacterium]
MGKFNFFWCNKLETVTFEEDSQLERIGWGAFGYSSLPQIAIPDSVDPFGRVCLLLLFQPVQR